MADYDFLMQGQGIKLPDPLAQAQQAMSLAQLAGQHQLQQYTLQKAKRDDEATNALNAALPGLMQSGYSPQAIQQAMQQNPNAAAAILAQVQKQQAADAETGYKRAQTNEQTALAGKNTIEGKQKALDSIAQTAYQEAQNPSPLSLSKVKSMADFYGITLPDPAGQDPQSYLGTLANQALAVKDRLSLQETGRHNRTEEALTGNRDANTAGYQRAEIGVKQGELANSNMRARAAMVTADPFGMLGLNTGGGGGGGAMPAGPGGPAAGVPASDQAMASQVAPLTPAQQAMQDRDNASLRGGTPVQQAMQAGQTGDAFLASLPGAIAQQVKAYAEGRMPIPTGAALRAPQTQAMMQLVSQYDPSFDAINYSMRAKTAQDFAPQGKSGQNITALNTAIGHLAGLKESQDKLNNFGGVLTPLNSIVNPVEAMMGDPRQTAVTMHGNAVAGELAKVFRSTGMSEADINKWQAQLGTNQSPEQQAEVVRSAIDLMNSRLQAIGDAYSRGMGKASDGISLLSPEARAAYTKLTGGAKPPAETRKPGAPDATPQAPASRDDAIKQAMDAISKGAPRDKVMQRLQQMGITDARI